MWPWKRKQHKGSITVTGLHPYPVTEELFRAALADKFPVDEMTPAEVAQAERAVREELAALYVVEITVDDPERDLDLGDVRQPGSDQVPYDERYILTDGSGADQPPDGRDPYRTAFFLHFVDPRAGLQTPFGRVRFPPPTPLPERLARVMDYLPVD